MEYRVLGPLEVLAAGGEKLTLGGAMQQSVLAALLLRAGQTVALERLIDDLWDNPPKTAARTIQAYVSRLRRELPDGAIDSNPGGYRFVLDGADLDLEMFEQRAEEGHAALAAGEYERAALLLREALALWRGPALAGLNSEALRREGQRLEERRLSVLEDRTEADLGCGQHGELVAELTALVTEHPFREGPRSQLMRALYHSGRPGDALALYRDGRRMLVEELGMEPGQELRELEQAILRQDAALGPEPKRPKPGGEPVSRLEKEPPREKAPPHEGSAVLREERKVVTVFFADLVDFTATAERLDPEDVRAYLMPYYAHIRCELERFGGTVEKFIGDAVMALFGAPVAHEDDPERAVRAALAIRDWLAEQDVTQQARIAVATGEAHVTLGPLATEGGPVAVGDVVNTAARLQAVAPMNGVLVGERTFRATRHAIDYREAERFAAKGKSTPIRAWEAISVLAQPGVDPSRHQSPFVGRERELTALRERLAWAASEGLPQLVTILGVPGIGKTRLVSELQQAATANRQLRWLQGRSLPYGDGVSLWALGEIVKAEAGILESDPTVKAEQKLREAVDRIVHDPQETDRIALSLGALVALGGKGAATADRRADSFAAWRDFLEALADERPLVLVFEDLHWADDVLLDFIDELIDDSGDLPLLVVATARPELLERRPGWAGGKANALTVSLPPLSESDTRHLVAELLEQRPVPVLAEETLSARIGGNPLYAEQFCRMLLEHGRLEEVPESLQGIIAARLDALDDVEKRLLQDASIVGKVFWAGALEAMGSTSRANADELLLSLARREFVQRARRSSVAGDTEYAFRHELLCDVAYEGIPRAGKAERHRRVAEWIEALGRADDHVELVAHHYLAALDYGLAAREDVTEILDPAQHALQGAGLRAMRLSANERAVGYFSRAIDLLDRLPDGDERTRAEAELQLQLGVALLALRGLSAPEVERAYTRATELMMARAPAVEQFSVDFGLAIFHGQAGNFDRSARLVERLTELASQGDDSMKLQALHARWMNSLFSGQVDDAVAEAEEGLGIYRPEAHHATSFRFGNHDPAVCALTLQALAFALRGESVRAVTQMHDAIALGEQLGHAASLAQPLTELPWALQINGDADAALLEAERALTLEDEVAHPTFFGIAHAMRGWAFSRLGREEEGIAELARAFADELPASRVLAAMIGGVLAEVHLQHGQREAARGVLDQTQALTDSMPAYLYEPELMRVEAEWLRLSGREEEARGLLLRAISTAQKHGSRALAIRSALQLARSPSADHAADLRMLRDLWERLPPENDTDYGRETRTFLSESVATRLP